MKTDWKAFLADAGAEFEGDIVLHYGNPEREQEVTLSGMVFADLSHYGVISASGGDAESFLQGQLSNDIKNVTERHSQLSAYCTPKGRTLGLLRIFIKKESYYLRLPGALLEDVLNRLRKYVIIADVALGDASDETLRIGVSGESATRELAAITAIPEQENDVVHADGLTILRIPGIHPRFEIHAASLEDATRLWDSLNVRGAPVGLPAWRLLDILAGLPEIYPETAELFVPQMLNLQLIGGISFKKGCYPGQEIVARMQYLGTLKRRMYLGQVDSDQPCLPGDALYSATGGEQAVGRIVDAQPHPDGGQSALAVIQTSAAESDDLHIGSAAGPRFECRGLPYPLE